MRLLNPPIDCGLRLIAEMADAIFLRVGKASVRTE